MIDCQVRDGNELRVGPLRFFVRLEEPSLLTEDATSDAGARFLLGEEWECAADARLRAEVATEGSVRQAKQ